MELFSELNSSDRSLLERIHVLDADAVKRGEFLDCYNKPFPLADYVESNLEDHEQLSEFCPNVHLLLWIACRTNHDNIAEFKHQIQVHFPDTSHTDNLTDFVTELAHSIQIEIPSEDRYSQLKLFSELLQYEKRAPTIGSESTGYQVLSQYRESVRGLFFLPTVLFALPYFLQVHSNSNNLIHNSYISRICRRQHGNPATPDTRDWIHVLHFLQAHHNAECLTPPEVLSHFHGVFQDRSVSLYTRCLQLFTIYHPSWPRIWTLIGWKANRMEVQSVHQFLTDFPTPFYRTAFVNEFFTLFVH